MLPKPPRTITWLIPLLVVAFSLIASSLSQPAPALAQADPMEAVEVVAGVVEEWSIGNGLIWWGENCVGDESVTTATLSRQPTFSDFKKTVGSYGDGACFTYLYPLSSSDGLYYFHQSGSRIEKFGLEATQPQTIKELSSDQWPSGTLKEADGYLYWVSMAGSKVLRVRKDGSGDVETVANSAPTPLDVMVVGTAVYWTDTSGVWLTTVACASLPCGAAQFDDFGPGTNGYGLLHVPISKTQYNIYWVQWEQLSAMPAKYKIHYRTCQINEACVLAEIEPQSMAAPLSAAALPDPLFFYASADNWIIGKLVHSDNNIFWTEADSFNVATGDLKRRFIFASEEGVDTLATNQANIDDQLYVVNDSLERRFIFLSRRGSGIYRVSTSAASIERDFAAVDLEVTQGIQTLYVGDPTPTWLVANKPTVVRVYASQLTGPNAPNVEVWIKGSVNLSGEPLPGSPLLPLNPVRALTTGAAFDRANIQDSWNFLLPPSWTKAGRVTLEIEIDPRHLHTDPNRSNNRMFPIPNFHEQPPLCIWAVPVRTNTPLPSLDDPNVSAMIDQFERRFPIPDAWIFRDTKPAEEQELCFQGGFPYACAGPYELTGKGMFDYGDASKVLLNLFVRRLLSDKPAACAKVDAPVLYMGMVHPEAATSSVLGIANLPGRETWVKLPKHTPFPAQVAWNKMAEGNVMAQEIGHNYERKHVDCGHPSDIDTAYPYPPCQIANVGQDSYYGFDIASLKPIAPKDAADFMSYGYLYKQWVSDYTWNELFLTMQPTSAVAGATEGDAVEAGDSVFVTGLVDTGQNVAEISVVLVLPTSSVPEATRQMVSLQAAAVAHDDEPHAVYKLRLLDTGGNLLVERTPTLAPLDDHEEQGESFLFTDLFDAPAVQVATVQLLADNVLLDTIQVSPSKPEIEIQQPANGAVVEDDMTIAWTASDADPDDRLLFTVQYSYDEGTSWHTLMVNVPGTPDPSYQLSFDDLGSYHGSAPNAARIRVLASDGYNTTIGVSPAFTLKNRHPQPLIFTPAISQTFAGGEAVAFLGSATDAEDGGLSDQALQWQVDGIATGSGTGVTVMGLAPGPHVATLSATDSNSQTATASVTFHVAPLSVPLSGPLATAPLLDGFCEDASYAQGSALTLKPYTTSSTPEGALPGNVRVLRSDDFLWVCFSALREGEVGSDAFAGLRVDVDNSRDALAQASDVGFFVSENGSVLTRYGDGAGDFGTAVAEGLQAMVSGAEATWSAELRIDKAMVGGWEHVVGLSFGHHAGAGEEADSDWPYQAAWAQPPTWATAVFGSQPLLTALEPLSATVLGPSFTLTVEGSSLVSGTTLLWNGSVLATTHVDDQHLTAQVASQQLSSAATVQITARSPAPGGFVSNALPFVVQGAPPRITTLSPLTVTAGGPALTLTINGSHFANGARVLWNGAELTTQFVNSSQVKVLINSTRMEIGQSVGVAVANPAPDEQISPPVAFQVEVSQQALDEQLYLPATAK